MGALGETFHGNASALQPAPMILSHHQYYVNTFGMIITLLEFTINQVIPNAKTFSHLE